MLKKFASMILVSMSLPWVAQAEEEKEKSPNRARILFLIDLGTQIHSNLKEDTTVTSPAGTSKTSTSADSKDSKSAKPGGLQLGLLTEKWGMLANITPDTATTGLVGFGYAVFPGQYMGIAYAINNNSNHATDSKNLQGLLGYHVLPIDEASRVTVLWVIGKTNGRGNKTLAIGDSLYHATGTSFNLVTRYNYKIADNVFYSPSLAYRRNSTDIEFTEPTPVINVDVSRKETISEITPVSITLVQ